MINAPCLWYRKVGDTFTVTSHDLGETLQKLNDINENIELLWKKHQKKIYHFWTAS